MTTYPIVAPDMTAIMSRAANYARLKWWPGKGYPQGIPALANTEQGIRGAAMVALALAVGIKLGLFNSTVNQLVARQQAARLIAAVARQHRTNTSRGWGGGWQTALWAAIAAEAAMLGWTTLVPNATEHNNVIRMLVYEADVRLAQKPVFWRNAAGVELRPGDSAGEENSWNSALLVQAAAMLPDHARAGAWLAKATELSVTAFSTRADCRNAMLVNGRPLSSWCAGGYNVQDNGLMVNHGRVNPDYTATMWQSLHVAVVLAMVGRPAPQGLAWGAYRSWRALSVADVGGGFSAYRPGSPLIRYAVGSSADWGVRRPAVYLAADAHVRWLGMDNGPTPIGAAYWEGVHAADIAWMQSRPVTKTHPANAVYDSKYVRPPEDSYNAREEWAMHHVAGAALAAAHGPAVTWMDGAV